jgi:hypothetical protein
MVNLLSQINALLTVPGLRRKRQVVASGVLTHSRPFMISHQLPLQLL